MDTIVNVKGRFGSSWMCEFQCPYLYNIKPTYCIKMWTEMNHRLFAQYIQYTKHMFIFLNFGLLLLCGLVQYNNTLMSFMKSYGFWSPLPAFGILLFLYICYCPLRDPNWNKNIVLYCIVGKLRNHSKMLITYLTLFRS